MVTRLSQESQDKVKKIINQVVDALRKLSNGEQEPRYVLVEERDLVELHEITEYLLTLENIEVIKESLLDTKEYLKTLLKDSDSLSFEEKEMLLERLSNRKSIRLADSEERS